MEQKIMDFLYPKLEPLFEKLSAQMPKVKKTMDQVKEKAPAKDSTVMQKAAANKARLSSGIQLAMVGAVVISAYSGNVKKVAKVYNKASKVRAKQKAKAAKAAAKAAKK